MKLNIKNIHIHVGSQPPAGLIAALAISSAANTSAHKVEAPAIGEKWTGTEAIYAGVSLSRNGDSLIHLIVWPEEKDSLTHEQAEKFAASVNPDMQSHLPTRHQGIDLFERLQDHFKKDGWYWLETKTNSGKTAFGQPFSDGCQGRTRLSSECRVRAVSEIPL